MQGNEPSWRGKNLFDSTTVPLFVLGLFEAFDENRDNHIDFKEMACGISACCRGPQAERQKCE